MKNKKFWTYENKLVVIVFFTIGFVFFDRLAINYLFPMISADLKLNYTQLGLLGAALALTWSVSGPLGGFISDKVKSKKSMLSILVLAFSIISLAHGLAQSFAMLFVLRLLMGIVEGPLIPQTQSILAMESSERRKGFNLGFTMNTSNALFGSILAPVVIVALATNFDWHTAFYLTIIPGLILSFVILKSVKNPDPAKFHAMHTTKSTEKVKVKDVLKHRNIWLSVVVFSLVMTTLMAFQIFGPTYLVKAKGLSETTMSFVMASFGVGYAIFGFLIPTISERTGRKPASLLSGLLLILIPLAIVYVDSIPLMMLLLFIGSAGSGVIGMSMSVIPVESVPLQYSGLAIGLTIGIGELIGGFLNPMVNGALADKFGIQTPLLVAAGAAVLALLFTFFFKETAPSKVHSTNGPEIKSSVQI
ncbi:MFS transporter [Neobacillus drentensis]|uniref:MFS transporter n=1 Tax=Neobacillus drentensis TaxID=220684 RepID=UPI002855BCBA|nr:MFS transporter [Neobacillus drentensis]MDR7236580.1 MFS family permease [Neobacillus drentensis]